MKAWRLKPPVITIGEVTYKGRKAKEIISRMPEMPALLPKLLKDLLRTNKEYLTVEKEALLERAQVFWDYNMPVPFDLAAQLQELGIDVEALETENLGYTQFI